MQEVTQIFSSKTQMRALTALDWLRQEELQEEPPKNGYFQIYFRI